MLMCRKPYQLSLSTTHVRSMKGPVTPWVLENPSVHMPRVDFIPTWKISVELLWTQKHVTEPAEHLCPIANIVMQWSMSVFSLFLPVYLFLMRPAYFMGLIQNLLVLAEKSSVAMVASCSGCRMFMKDCSCFICVNLARWVSNQLGYWKLLKRKQWFWTFRGQISIFRLQCAKTLPFLLLHVYNPPHLMLLFIKKIPVSFFLAFNENERTGSRYVLS